MLSLEKMEPQPELAAIKTVLITGGARGIGWATAEKFLKEGWRVAVGTRDAQRAADCTRIDPDHMLGLELDVRSREAAQSACDRVIARWGRLDVLVNNAGVQRHAALADVSPEDWQSVLDVNLTGVLVCMQAAARHMLDQQFGSIVNVASIAAARGVAGRAVYAASKAAVVSLTMSAAVEWAGDGIRVNAVAPGYVETPLLEKLLATRSISLEPVLARTPMGRMGSPDDIAEVVAFLAGDAGRFITGQTIWVDGGFLADYGVPAVHNRSHQVDRGLGRVN